MRSIKQRKKNKYLCLPVLPGILFAVCLLTGCGKKEAVEAAAEPERTGAVAEKETLTEDGPITDNMELYANDDETSVVTMYLTVRPGNQADNTDHTWAEINAYSTYYYDENNLDRYNVEAILQVGDENGPVEGEFGYGAVIPNATVQVRGQTSSKLLQKNYKVRIKENMGSWRGQRTLALNKHVSDVVRFRNKLAYDLMKDIPQMMSARTQFVHLYVKDETEGGNGEFTDYGLYTMVEQINKTYLESHGLDRRGSLYKVNFFEWYEYDPIMKLKTDPDYDADDFEEYLEIKGSDDHSSLQSLLKEINDYTIPIEEIVEKHFDMDNICYWTAFHILIGNYDVGSRNSYIYSPLNSEKWYIISWDNDASFARTYYEMQNYSEGGSWERGLTQFLHLSLFDRIFREEKYRQALDDAIMDLKENYLTEEKVAERVNRYAEVVKPYVYSMPDQEYAYLEADVYDYIVECMPKEIEMNYQYYLESLEKPWPFYVDTPQVIGDQLAITWNAAYDIDQEEITYSFWLASDYAFENVIAHQEDLRIPGVSVDMPETGEYFIRVRAKNASGYEQDCYDYYSVDNVGKVYGAKCFYVDEDGNISEYVGVLGDN